MFIFENTISINRENEVFHELQLNCKMCIIFYTDVNKISSVNVFL